MAKQVTIEDIDIIFNGDKRGRQYFIINTDGLTNFDVANLDPNSPYGKIRNEIGNNEAYKTVQDNFFKNILAFNNDKTSEYAKKILENFYDDQPKLVDSNLIKISDVIAFVNSVINKVIILGVTAGVVESDSGQETIDVLDKYIAKLLKEAWKTYKIQKESYDRKKIINSLNPDTDIKTSKDSPFNNSQNKIVKIDDKYYKLTQDGEFKEFNNDKINCTSYGFDNNNDCNGILYKCLLDPSKDNLDKCINMIDDNMQINTGTSDDNLEKMNPEIVLALLYRFGFKAIRDKTGRKYIITTDKWEEIILPNLNIQKSSVTKEVKKYLDSLINYVNSNPEILNPNMLTSYSFYDKATNKDKFGKSVDPSSTDKIALEGLSRFYETRKNYGANNVNGLMRDLYARYDFNIPNYLQSGGASPYDILKAQLDKGDAGVAYLEKVYKSLINSLTNVDMDQDVIQKMNSFIGELKTKQNDLIGYLEFVDKVNQAYNLFKYAPAKVSITGNDIDELNENLKIKIKEFKDKEDKLARFIQALAKKEINPLDENSVFDI